MDWARKIDLRYLIFLRNLLYFMWLIIFIIYQMIVSVWSLNNSSILKYLYQLLDVLKIFYYTADCLKNIVSNLQRIDLIDYKFAGSFLQISKSRASLHKSKLGISSKILMILLSDLKRKLEDLSYWSGSYLFSSFNNTSLIPGKCLIIKKGNQK